MQSVLTLKIAERTDAALKQIILPRQVIARDILNIPLLQLG